MQKVLIVDDSRDAADALVLLLASHGYAARVAYDGPSALRDAGEFRPDAVLLDIGLPGMNGAHVAGELRRRHGSRMRIIAYTAFDNEVTTRSRLLGWGFDGVLRKPSTLEQVVLAIAGHPSHALSA